ncbi:MAG: thermonuclease family protein [Synergistaceae bacterium]|nr:thermonuclease family protein [Synergistaceae bacterium]
MAKKQKSKSSWERMAKQDPKKFIIALVALLLIWGLARLTGQDVSIEELAGSLLGGTRTEQPKEPQTPAQGTQQPQKGDLLQGTVTRVVDGDTLVVEVDGQSRRVRMLGVDTPETVHPNKEVQYYGPEASAFTKKELTGQRVWLEYDVAPLDRYQRHLAYIWTEKPSGGEAAIRKGMFNARLLLGGYAKVMTIQPNSRHADLFVKLQEEARKARRGLWKGQK